MIIAPLHFHGVGDVEPGRGVDQLVPLNELLHLFRRQCFVRRRRLMD